MKSAWFRDKKAKALFVHTVSLKASAGVEGSRQNKSPFYKTQDHASFALDLARAKQGEVSCRSVALENSAR